MLVKPGLLTRFFGGLGTMALTAVPPTCDAGPKPTELNADTLTSTG